jgi:hypothetical protein
MAAGTRHWLKEVKTGNIAVFCAGDEHDALYAPGSLYATATLTHDRLQEIAAQAGLVLDARTLGGKGVASPRFAESDLAKLERDSARRMTASAASAPPPLRRSAHKCWTGSSSVSDGRRASIPAQPIDPAWRVSSRGRAHISTPTCNGRSQSTRSRRGSHLAPDSAPRI